ncbi:MAG: TolC family protein [Muribaculaceae bacterium]|nr:TolC family protein [Muribaculaceae bacterium]
MKHILTILAAALLLAGCSGTRNLKRPDLRLPSTIDGVSVDSLSAADVEWFQFYSDPTLSRIIAKTLENNRDLLKASARVEELRQLYGVNKLNYLPTVTGIVGATKETNDYYGEKFSNDPELSVKATVNWEIDLWGGLSQARRQAGAQYQASVETQRALQITLIAEAATAYFNLVALENELDIVGRTLKSREQALEMARLRYEGGLTSEIVYQQAKVQVATTAALIPSLNSRIAMARNAITLLMGEYPGESLLEVNAALNENLIAKMPVGLPSALLERRPDLRASELRLQAAMAGVGVAYSNQFPKLRLAVTGGWENDVVQNLFRSPFSYLLGNITGTIFDFGRNHRKYKAAIAAYDQARLDYEKSVLTAFTEVNNAIVNYREMQQRVARSKELRDASFSYVDLAYTQYKGGTINYIDVLDAERRYFEAQVSLSNAVRDEYLAVVTLYKVLGGGWNTGSSN